MVAVGIFRMWLMVMALTYKGEQTSKEKSKYKSSEDAYVLKGKRQLSKVTQKGTQTS